MNNCDGESHRQWSICCSWHGSGFGICYVQYSLSIEGGLSGKWRKINKSKCLTQNTSQWNVLLTSFKVLLFHIRCQWFSRWFGLWFQGNNLIQGKNLRGSFVNVLNLSLSAGNIFKASIDTALNLGKSFWLKYLEPVRKFWVKGILSQKVLSLKYHILDNNGAFNLSSEKYANVSTAKTV